MNDKKRAIIATILTLIAVIIIISVSYALYRFTASGQVKSVISSGVGKIEIVYTESDVVDLSEMLPLTNEDGKKMGKTVDFSIKLDSVPNLSAYYAIGLDEVTANGTLTDKYVRIKLVRQDLNQDVIVEGTSINRYLSNSVGDEMNSYALLTNTISGGQTHTYKLTAWIGEDYPMNIVTEEDLTHQTTISSDGKEFSFKIKVVARDNNAYVIEGPKTLKETLLGENNSNIVTTGDGLYKEKYTPSSELQAIYQNNLSNGNLTTYYYKGTNVNNYVSFAGLTWRIIRINEDGSIRLILNDGINDNTAYRFNSTYKDYTYMYYSNSDVENGIKKTIDDWYNSNLSSYANYIETTPFCEEAKVKPSSSTTSGSVEMIAKEEYTPSFDCKTDGNGKGILRLNIGLVTIDEYLKSGGKFNSSSDTLNSYLTPKGYYYWTMSPAGFTAYNAYTFAWTVSGNSAGDCRVNYISPSVRPVISLKADTLISDGNDGTSANPYQVVTE